MKPADVFGIVVRTFGLSLLVYSVWYFVFGVVTILGALHEEQPGYRLSYFVSGVTFLVIALYLLRGAPHILRFSYPDRNGDTQDANKELVT